jgi:hypothetical protein
MNENSVIEIPKEDKKIMFLLLCVVMGVGGWWGERRDKVDTRLTEGREVAETRQWHGSEKSVTRLLQRGCSEDALRV